jgi:hypothetical protein
MREKKPSVLHQPAYLLGYAYAPTRPAVQNEREMACWADFRRNIQNRGICEMTTFAL